MKRQSHRRAFFAPGYPGDWGAPDNDRVWVIVAYGQFQPTNIDVTDPSPDVKSATWAAAAEGTDLLKFAYSNQSYDLSPLGTPSDLDRQF